MRNAKPDNPPVYVTTSIKKLLNTQFKAPEAAFEFMKEHFDILNGGSDSESDTEMNTDRSSSGGEDNSCSSDSSDDSM